jgi:hypothetical protein
MRAVLVPQQVTRQGLTPVFSTVTSEGVSVANDGRMVLEVKNTSASSVNVTVQTPGSIDGLAIADLVVAVPATNGDKIIGPFQPGIYNQPDGTIYVDFSAVASVTVAALRVS